MFETGQRVGVAVSGGADSIALLMMLRDRGLHLTVLHVNHRLRGSESDGDEHFVRELAANLGLGVLVHHAVPEPGNLEAETRRARYAWFHRLLANRQFDRIATGHTASDQAETVLFRFLRGAGSAGLASIRPVTAEGIVPPLVHLRREEVRAYLVDRNIAWREDSSNADSRFARNRIRHHLLPELEREWNPALTKILNQTAEWARAEEVYWDAEIPIFAARCVHFHPDSAILLTLELAMLPQAAARRVVRFAIETLKRDLRGIDFSHVDSILELSSRPNGNGAMQVPGLHVQRSFDRIRLSLPRPELAQYHQLLNAPDAVIIPGAASTLQLERKSVDSVYNIDEHQLDWELLSGALELRCWRPGDRFRQAGHSSAAKLKNLYQKARIPVWDRRLWPVITLAGSVVWTRRFGAAADFAPSAKTRTVLAIREIPNQIA